MSGNLKSKLRRPEYIILLVYTPLIVAITLISFFQGEFDKMTPEITGFLALFFLFLISTVLSFKRNLLSGILFLIWVAGVIFVDLTLVEEEKGAATILSIPILAVGLLLIQRATEIKKKGKLKGSI